MEESNNLTNIDVILISFDLVRMWHLIKAPLGSWGPVPQSTLRLSALGVLARPTGKDLGGASVAAGGGLEPAEGFAQGSGVAAAHGCPQPDHHPVSGDCQTVAGCCPPARAGFWWFLRSNRSCREFGRSEPIRARTCKRASGDGSRMPLRDRASDGQLQQGSDLLLGCPYCFQDFPRKPDTCAKEGKLTEEIAQRIPIALHPSGEIVHGLTFGLGQV